MALCSSDTLFPKYPSQSSAVGAVLSGSYDGKNQCSNDKGSVHNVLMMKRIEGCQESSKRKDSDRHHYLHESKERGFISTKMDVCDPSTWL